MVPAPALTAQQRWRTLAADKSVFTDFFPNSKLTQPPKITYGKKTTMPLSLTGGQFRGSVYDIPPDHEDEDEEFSPRFVKAKVTRESRTEHLAASKPAQKSRQSKVTPQKTTSKKCHIKPARRLPVNELLLVASPPSYPNNDPLNSCPGVEALDPISSSPCKRTASPIESDDDQNAHKAVETPLTTIRRRFPTSKWKHKLTKVTRRPKDEARTLLTRNNSSESKGRDGFDASEVLVTGHRKTRKLRAPKTPLVPKFHALQLRSGPLPDVEFESCVKPELQTQDHEVDDMPVYLASDHQLHQDQSHDRFQRSGRRVSFTGGLLNEVIRAQLSSISAPERQPSESEDSDMEAEDDKDVEQVGSEDAESDCVLDEEDQGAADLGEDVTEEPENAGMTFHFRRPKTHGQDSLARSLQRRDLMEVRESIVEVPDTSPTKSSTRRRISQPRQQRFDLQAIHRPRSILTNSLPAIPDSTTMSEQTAANTRRNSIVNLSESRYFTNASNVLHTLDPTRHVVVPRRTSPFCYSSIEIPDSDRVVPETSPERFQYTEDSQLKALRGTEEAVWAPPSNTVGMTGVPKDLMALTRSVIREHGTLSQSVRRRPSLPFHSPTKIR